ncbi:hypothetical protein EP331_02605 [bacterium]|nr:MAG: hypothetical protein EP331_02605 [bacterium]
MYFKYLYITWQWFLRAFFAIAGLVAFIVLLGWGLLNLTVVRNAIVSSVSEKIESTFHTRISVGDINGIVPFGVSLNQVSLLSTAGKQEDTLATVQRIYANLDIWSLWNRQLKIVSFEMVDPLITVKTDSTGELIWAKAFARKDSVVAVNVDTLDKRTKLPKLPIEIYAPELKITNGYVHWELNEPIESNQVKFPAKGNLSGIYAKVFLEYLENQIYLDIEHVEAMSRQIPSIRRFKAQGFVDNENIELNAIHLSTDKSLFDGTLKIARPKKVILTVYDLLENHIDLQLNQLDLQVNEWKKLFPQLQSLKHDVEVKLDVKGDLRKLEIGKLDIRYGDAELLVSGKVDDMDDFSKLNYSVDIKKLQVKPGLVQTYVNMPEQLQRLKQGIEAKGKITGNFNKSSLSLKINETGKKGFIDVRGSLVANDETTFTEYDANIAFKELDIQSFLPENEISPINGTVKIKGSGLQNDLIQANVDASFQKLKINSFSIDTIRTQLHVDAKYLDITSNIKKGKSSLSLNGDLDLQDSIPVYSLSGVFQKVNVTDWVKSEKAPETQLDGNFEWNGAGIKPDDIFGRVSFDITNAIVNNDTLKPHQIYADLDGPKSAERRFRVTSSLFDLDVKGALFPTKWQAWFNNWTGIVEDQLSTIYLFENQDSLLDASPVFTETQKVEIDFRTKNLSLIKAYFADLPLIQSTTNAKVNLETGNGALVATGKLKSDSLRYNDFYIKNGDLDFTLAIRNLNDLRRNASIVVKSHIDEFRQEKRVLKSVGFELNQENDSLKMRVGVQDFDRLGELDLGLFAKLEEESINARLSHFLVGNSSYLWTGKSKSIILDSKGTVFVDSLIFNNKGQSVFLNGSFSNFNADSMAYRVNALDLEQISNLLHLKYDLSGTLDGMFYTKTLTSIPQFAGQLNVANLQMGKRPVGNAEISSKYDAILKRFDTSLQIKLDSISHPEYWKNSKLDNNLAVNGYIYRPDNTFTPADTLYFFDIDIKKADMWMLNYFIPQIYSKIEGPAKGSGYFTGGLGWIDFSTRFELDEILTVPKFLNTNFYMSGPVIFGYHEGVVFDNIKIHDGLGGQGLLNGAINMDYFGDNRSYDILAEFNRMEFLNSSFEDDIPFYGKVAGSGSIKMSGPISKPFLETLGPIRTTSNSRLSIPLIDKEKVDSQSRFIEFVESFDTNLVTRNTSSSTNQTNTTNSGSQVNTINQPTPSRSFTEIFQMNLQFTSPDDTQFELVFDPITGEVLNATGGGSLNITLEDEELKMYGFFDVYGGTYNFVAGDVFTRRFIINEGGTLSWEGAPQNPRVNLTAVYRSRPNLQPISGQDVRVPVDLILKLGGTIEALQNDFYFEIPNTTFQDANLNTALRLLNSEDQKLPQATSLLLTGNFFAVNAAGTDNSFGNNLQNNATQAGLSQLLSNQINTILNNSISNLDIDLNLNGFDQADLGIALRLFDDRLVLRREGQIINNQAGATNQNLIGDLGASFKISRALSVEVFYRQDPTLGGFSAVQDQAQNVSGVGLQYQVQFNRWRDLPGIIWRNIKDFFGFGKKEKQDIAAVR